MRFRPTPFIARQIWDLSEWTGISLGRFAPHIFGAMIGSKAIKKKQDE